MIIYTYGVFDLLHMGHIRLLEEAKKLGEFLVVGVFTDKAAASFKREPIIRQNDRFRMLKALKAVDLVVFQEEVSPLKVIEFINPDIVAKGPGAGFEKLKLPVKKILLAYHNGYSTTEIIKRCQTS